MFQLVFRPAAIATVAGLIGYFLWLHRSRLEERFRDARGRLGRLEQAIDELSERELRARELSWHDPLTGLANRRLGLERLREALTNPNTDGFRSAVVFADLDDFKAVNDRGGHEFGDAVLVHVAEAFRSTVRNTDTLARFGGDEFLLVMPRVASELDVEMVARRMLGRLAALRDPDGRPTPLAASLGLALAPDHGTTPEELLRASDAAMYREKSAGGARFGWAGPIAVPEPTLEDSGEHEAPTPAN
jgi:diguanylate cyclase (GGDEF)-like protein